MKQWIVQHMKPNVAEIRGSAAIVEFTIVLPLCFMIVGSLIFIGIFLFRYALLDAAADSAVHLVRYLYADPVSLNAEDDPYRFLSGGYHKAYAEELIRESIRDNLKSGGWIKAGMHLSEIEIALSERNGMLNRWISVTIRQYVSLPPLFERLSGGTPIRMEVISAVPLSCPPEMIRNTDFVMDLTERVSGIGLQEKINETLSKAAMLFGSR